MSLTDVFFTRLLAGAKDKIDYALVAKLAHETNNIQFAVQANKDAQQKLGVFLWEDGYPVPAVLGRDPEKALVSAIIYRESMFDKDVVSPAGAMGLMQLMPATAKETAQRGGFGYSRQKLTQDPAYNIRLGSAYLSKLVGGYDGFYPYAIAAYNGGPSNVNSWIDDYGDPAEGKADLVDWVESIPVYETRNYVQRVLETYYMYRIRYGQEPKTIFNFVQ